MTSPTDKMFERMDASKYVCVLRELVEEIAALRKTGCAFWSSEIREAEEALIDAATDEAGL